MSHQVFAWGDLGHRVIGQIAQQNLTPSALKAVLSISNEESLAQISTWADEVRADDQFDWLKPFHFINADAPTFDHETHNHDAADIYNGINKYLKVLRSKDASQTDKREALALVVHFIGDIHQPLHVGFSADFGANSCKVQYFGRATNLHSVIDSGVIEHSGLSFSETARFIIEQKNNLVEPTVLSELSRFGISSWVQESIQLRLSLYPNSKTTKWIFKGGNTDEYLLNHGYCKLAKTETNPDLIPKIEYLYNYHIEKILRKQLLIASFRLAYVLNSIFSN